MAKILVGGFQMNDKIKEQILEIRKTGITNMFDVITVQRIAFEMDFYELVDFLETDRKAYVDYLWKINYIYLQI